nr:MAK10-like protein [Tanacetum cinerariifolium]
MGEKNSNQPRTLGDYYRPSHEGYRNAIELPKEAKVFPLRFDTIRLVQNKYAFHGLRFEGPIQHLKEFLKIMDSIDLNGATKNTTQLCLFYLSLRNQAINWLDHSIDYAAGERLRKLRMEEAWETVKDLAQQEEENWNNPIFFEKESPDYINATLEQELESMKCQVESLMRSEVLLDYEVKIEAQRVHSTKMEKITKFHTYTPTVTPEILKHIMVHRVLIISNIKPTIYRTPHQYLNSNLKMPILYSFEENRLEYEDEDEVEIKMMGSGMDKESLEHNLYEHDITSIICHNFSLTSNLPIKPKDSGSFRMKVVEPLTIYTPPSPHVAYFYRNVVLVFDLQVIFDEKKHGSSEEFHVDNSWMTI